MVPRNRIARPAELLRRVLPAAGGPSGIAGTIDDHEFNQIRSIIYKEAGISLSEAKRALVCSRLAKRLRDLSLPDYAAYLAYLEASDPDGAERQIMVNCLTTNKTDFFREPHHFDFLRTTVFPEIERRARAGGPRRLRMWSAGCSTGEEPYSLAMTVLEHFRSLRGWDVQILASDINTEVLDTARSGIYPLDRIEPVEPRLRERYFLRGTGQWLGCCQVHPEVRRLVTFRQINFQDASWRVPASFDVIFCRNVIIYFDVATQRRITLRFAEHLADGGYLMLGHSEHPPWLAEVLSTAGNTVYRQRRGGHPPAAGQAPAIAETAVRPAASARTPSPVVRGPVQKPIEAGQLFATGIATEISTRVGACVAVCLFDPDAKVSGMNHFLLPFHTQDPQVAQRYGVHAMQRLICKIEECGGQSQRLRAKLFGGCTATQFPSAAWNVGEMNHQFVRRFLRDRQIPLAAECCGGDSPLWIRFRTDTAQAFVRPLDDRDPIFQSEEAFSQRASQTASQLPP